MQGGIFYFYEEFNRTLCKQTVKTLTRRRVFVASDLVYALLAYARINVVYGLIVDTFRPLICLVNTIDDVLYKKNRMVQNYGIQNNGVTTIQCIIARVAVFNLMRTRFWSFNFKFSPNRFTLLNE